MHQVFNHKPFFQNSYQVGTFTKMTTQFVGLHPSSSPLSSFQLDMQLPRKAKRLLRLQRPSTVQTVQRISLNRGPGQSVSTMLTYSKDITPVRGKPVTSLKKANMPV